MSLALTTRERSWLASLIGLIVGFRLVTLGAYPLMETTESRYAEIARKMLETGDWLMPQFDYGVPFWGKPPLSTWLSASSMAAFGVNEFAARLPSFLLLAGCGWLVYAFAALRGGRDQALWSLALFATIGMVFIAAGGVMTDPALVLGTTLSMAGFWTAVHGAERSRRVAGLAFFTGLGVGLLAKGPVAAVLVFIPVGLATFWTRSWRPAWQRLPWVTGLASTFTIATAWYWAAERASPGFLDYFLIGEHWKRFVEPGWKGDLYGSAHARTHGAIWLFWIAAALPWSVGALAWLIRTAARERDRVRSLVTDPWRAYLLLWTVTPMLFFTPAGNILATYVLPGLPSFALLLGEIWRLDDGAPDVAPGGDELRLGVWPVLVAAILLPLGFATAIVVLHARLESERSQKALVRDFEKVRTNPESHLVYFPLRPPSAEFYSGGKAQRAPDAPALRRFFVDATPDFFAVRERDLAAMSAADQARLQRVRAYGEYQLLREAPR